MRAYTDLKCPGCLTKNQVHFDNPTRFRPTIFTFVCKACQSSVLVKAQLPKQLVGKGQLYCSTKVVTYGPEIALRKTIKAHSNDQKEHKGEGNV